MAPIVVLHERLILQKIQPICIHCQVENISNIIVTSYSNLSTARTNSHSRSFFSDTKRQLCIRVSPLITTQTHGYRWLPDKMNKAMSMFKSYIVNQKFFEM